jgi:hypothetical protein
MVSTRVAHGPSVPHADDGPFGPSFRRCPELLCYTSEEFMAWLARASKSPSASGSPVGLDISSLAVAGSRPATDQSVQEALPPPDGAQFGFSRADNGVEIRP